MYDVLEFLIRVQCGRQRTGGRPRKKGQLSPAAEPRAAHQCTEEDEAEEEMAGSERAFDSTKTVSSGRQKSYRIKINVVRNIPICIHNCFQATSKISTTVLDELGLKVFPRCLNSVFQKLDVDVGILARHACYLRPNPIVQGSKRASKISTQLRYSLRHIHTTTHYVTERNQSQRSRSVEGYLLFCRGHLLFCPVLLRALVCGTRLGCWAQVALLSRSAVCSLPAVLNTTQEFTDVIHYRPTIRR